MALYLYILSEATPLAASYLRNCGTNASAMDPEHFAMLYKRHPGKGRNVFICTISMSLKFSHKPFFCISNHILNAQWEYFIQINKIFTQNFYSIFHSNKSQRNLFFLKREREELHSQSK